MDVTSFDPPSDSLSDDSWRLCKEGSSSPPWRGGAPPCPTLDVLIAELRRTFENDHVDVDYVKQLFANYKSNPREWKKYAKRDPHRYTRNLIDKGNGKYNMLLLCWNEAQGSAIHDHADSHCFMKVVEGELHEELYSWPNPEQTTSLMTPREVSKFGTNSVAYINDTVGLHRVENKSHTEPACSIHLYIPPFEECSSFDQRSGKQQRCKVTFYSEYGKRTPYGQLAKRPAQTMDSQTLKQFGKISVEDN